MTASGIRSFGTFLLFAAFVLLLVACLATPLFGPDHDFAIAKATITDEVLSFVKVQSHLRLGVFGYCYTVIGKTNHCSASELGYELPPLFAILGRVTGLADESDQNSLRSVTKAFVLHPIACALAFVAVVLSIGAPIVYDRRRATALRTVEAASIVLCFTAALATVVIDCVFLLVAQERIEARSRRVSVEVTYAAATWLTISALVLEFFSVVMIIGSDCLTSRKRSKEAVKEVRVGADSRAEQSGSLDDKSTAA
ncbi:hypothetical protein JCM3766R1_003937 [Sporobolomyces carnicolor]